ncbi:MAG TPA: hypothetical protein VFJ76_07810 [Solirubrobacterales bacterium]|nr:hypothetical protein [Solirubrobacterales bacterium]
MKYLYSDDAAAVHRAFLFRVGAIGNSSAGKGHGPKSPPKHTAKATKTKESKNRRRTREPKYNRYAAEERRKKHKAARVARDHRRAAPLNCGHGIRHLHPDGDCRRCFAEVTS